MTNWAPDFEFGQISAVDIDSSGNIWVFHRGAIVWNNMLFDAQEQLIKKTPVDAPAVIKLHPDGTVLAKHGASM